MGNTAKKTRKRLERRIKGYEADRAAATPQKAAMMRKPGSQNRNK